MLKDHEIARLVNELTDVARKYAGTQQLRGQISEVVVKALRPAPSIIGDNAKPHPFDNGSGTATSATCARCGLPASDTLHAVTVVVP